MTDDELDAKLRVMVRAIGSTGPGPRPFPLDQIKDAKAQAFPLPQATRTGVAEPSPDAAQAHGSRRGVRIAVAVLVAVAVTASAVVLAGRLSKSHTTTPLATVGPIQHEVIDYSQTASIVCAEGSPTVEGDFDSSTIEAWGDASGQRWRETVTYPDGSSRSLIDIGSPWYPTSSYHQGMQRGRDLGCSDGTNSQIHLAPPAADEFFSLNPLAPIPTSVPGDTTSLPPGMPPFPVVETYRDIAKLVPGDTTDSQGRPSQLWRQTVTGYESSLGVHSTRPEAARWPTTQTTDWYVNSDTGLVTEQTYHASSPLYGEVSWTATLRQSSVDVAPADLFDTQGFTPY
jgi:hypothetical protein